MVASVAQKIARKVFSYQKHLLTCRSAAAVSVSKRHNGYTSILQGDTVRIGCASGFWGDSMVAGLFTFNKGR